nr:glycosyltransferase family 2 protein [uncultured Leptotrichia sp.]
MKQEKKIEILLATYNGEKYLNEQIDSIINQTYTNWKLLIRDDGSEDRTLEILKEYEKRDERISILRDNKGNLGFVKNFEELLKNSSEEFIMFSDQDDYWLENKIEKYIGVLENLDVEKLKKPLLIHSNSFVCDEKLNILKKNFVDSKVALQYGGNGYFFAYFVQGSTTLINRKLIDLGLPFLKSVTLHDRYFHLLVEFFGNRIFIDESLIKYRQHRNNEIGAKSSIIKKILFKRYFDDSDRDLILDIEEKYRNKQKKDNERWIIKYLEVTDRKKNRMIRVIKSFMFRMNIRKRIFVLLKG